MSWKKLSTKELLNHPRIRVLEDEVLLPGGHKTTYIRLPSGDGAIVIALDNRGKILLQKEYSYPQDTKLFQFPGGALESGESPIQGAAREFAEEAQLKGTLTQIGWLYAHNRRSSGKLYVFAATQLAPCPTENDPEEAFEDYWYEAAEINHLIKTSQLCNPASLAAWAFFIQTDLYTP